ncbi:MAG: hypothetical protein ACT4QF_02485 [Sporichthyaceae bacterium]
MELGVRVVNQAAPQGSPVRPMGRIPVIARLVTAEGVELRPGVAIRWTSTQVMVCIEDHTCRPVRAEYLWLAPVDVVRVLALKGR